MEKRLAPGKHATQQRVPGIAPLQHRVAQQGQQVEAEHTRREVPLAVTKVVLQMVALGLEHGGVFVCDLPPPTTRLRNVHNGVNRQAMSGDTAIVRQLFARCGIDDRALEPMDRHGTSPLRRSTSLMDRTIVTAVKRPFQWCPACAAIASLACQHAQRS